MSRRAIDGPRPPNPPATRGDGEENGLVPQAPLSWLVAMH
jgi:hypothetical protein